MIDDPLETHQEQGAGTLVADMAVDSRAPASRLLRDLRTTARGLTEHEATLRLASFGPNTLIQRGGLIWPGQVLKQFTQPLAILLMAAGVLAYLNHTHTLGVAIFAVVLLNAVFAFFQERHAEHAVEALASYLPTHALVIRGGERREISAPELVPGDILVIGEGDRISADARLLDGAVEVDLSTLTGESQPVARDSAASDVSVPLLESTDTVFSGSACMSGEATSVVTATGMRTEIGRIAALSQRGKVGASPLERQIRDVARLISVIAVAAAAALLPLGLLAGLSLGSAISFAIGMLVANVPEGLLPTITLALAVGVRKLASRGAVVKRLSAVETLGSTNVICTDKTGTLTQNRMETVGIWTPLGQVELDEGVVSWPADAAGLRVAARGMALAAALCSTAEVVGEVETGDPTEIALVKLASAVDLPLDAGARQVNRAVVYRFDPRRRLMSTIERTASGHEIHVKGATEAVLPRCTRVRAEHGFDRAITDADQLVVTEAVEGYAKRGLRVIAFAARTLAVTEELPTTRESAESDLVLLGVVALLDPPRREAADAIVRAHDAGIRIHVVTGDNGTTATEIARRVGVGTGPGGVSTITGTQLDAMSDDELAHQLGSSREFVFARSSPEAKLRIAERIKANGDVVAMTGDGVNDAPALRAADIGVAMGRSGTEVARQAATIVLTDDNFATIVDAVEEGRRVYDNVRKFIFYILSHSVPEVVPFVLYALSGGAIPLPLTVMQLLAIDLVTDTLPALALSREPAEPGLMTRPPRARHESVIGRALLWRAWGAVGVVSAALVLLGFFAVLLQGGWGFHDSVGVGSVLHHTYVQATTVAWLGIVACQVGTAMAARSQGASLRSIGFFSNPVLLWAIGVEMVLTALIILVPVLQDLFDTTTLAWWQVAMVLPFPAIVWGLDELLRWRRRTRAAAPVAVGAVPERLRHR